MRRLPAALLALGALGVLGAAAGCGGSAKAAAPVHLRGRFAIAPGACSGADAKPTGSYLVVISAGKGRAVHNPHGGCTDPSYTLLRPGTDGGFTTGSFQPGPAPAFDGHGDATAARIVRPVRFGRLRLGLATDSRDEQDAPGGEPAFPAPAALDSAGALSVDLRSLVMTYGGRPGSTCKSAYGVGCWALGSESATGTYDSTTHRYVLDWFTGEAFVPNADSVEVHLEGTFRPESSS